MSAINFEETADATWKVIVSATQKASLIEEGLRLRGKRPIISYEQFVEETKLARLGKPKYYGDNNDYKNSNDAVADGTEAVAQEDIYALGDWNSDNEDEYENFVDDDESSESEKDQNDNKVIKRKKDKFKKRYKSSKLRPIVEKTEDNSSSDEDKAVFNNQDNLHAYSQDDDDESWESISSCCDDENSFEDFLKISKQNANPLDADHDFGRFMPYANLSECLLSQYYPHSENTQTAQPQRECKACKSDKKRRTYDYQKEFQRNGQVPLEERLPLMQVLDALDDINKVLKVGKITPRMERILEYKQDYPFTEGYEEEKLGCCPWLVYKIERFCKKLGAKQWPY